MLRTRLTELHRQRPIAAVVVPATLALALPLIVAVVTLSGRRFYPVLDLAMTEFRVRDVGSRQTPLVGLPGRIGNFPDQGSHPGPFSFWALAPGYRLFGSSAWAMEASTALLQTVWIGVALWIAHRRAGLIGVAVTSAAIAVLIRGFGLSVLTQPWNPYLPLIAWVVVLLAAWSVVAGDHAMLIPLAVAASFAAQTHIPYLLMAGAIGAAAAVLVAVRWWRSPDRQTPRRLLLITAGLFTLLWIPPVVDQLRRDPGNFRRLLDHFGDPPEDAIGGGEALTLLLRHLDVGRGLGGTVFGSGRLIELGQEGTATIIPGAVALLVWVGSVYVAYRLSTRTPSLQPLLCLHTVIGVALVLGWISMSRIFGPTWFYLTLWAWTIMVALVVAVVWTAIAVVADRSISIGTWPAAVAVSVAAFTTMGTVVIAPSTDHPEEQLGETLGAVIEPTVQALSDGVGDAVGPDGRYAVLWKDAHSFGSQGYGLVNELERRGVDAGVYEPWRVPVTSQRVVAIGDVDAEVIWVTGSFVEVWRNDDRVVEVATVEPRSSEELIEFADLRTTLIAELGRAGLDDLIAVVDSNLFGVLVDPRTPEPALVATRRMLDLGQNAAVFIGPPGVTQ